MLETMTSSEILSYYGIGKPAIHSRLASCFARFLNYFVIRFEKFVQARKLGLSLIALSLGALLAFAWPMVKLETSYWLRTSQEYVQTKLAQAFSLKSAFSQADILPTPSPQGLAINPLIDPEGNQIVPVNTDFALIVPKVGINAPIIAGVNPGLQTGYTEALKKGVAHSSLSVYPDEAGVVYLFSHSTNYEWFIKDLNAVFYYLKNIEAGDLVVIMYQGNRYTYKIREKRVVTAKETSYLAPKTKFRMLILQTCWPPGSTWKRLLIFADLIEEKIYGSFEEEIFRTDTNLRIYANATNNYE